jgi:hypothetical protein
MEDSGWRSMSSRELWDLHQSIARILRDKLLVKRAEIEKRLRMIDRDKQLRPLSAQRRSGKNRGREDSVVE